MSHELAHDTNGNTMFAYNDRQDPWHKLGTSVQGYMTADDALFASHTDWLIEEQPLYILVNGQPQIVEGRKARVRREEVLGDSGFITKTMVLGDVGSGNTVEQHSETVQWGFDLAGVSNGDAMVDTIGCLYDGVEFFVLLDLGTITLDPNGTADKIKRFLVVRDRADGSMSLNAFDTNVRVVCANTMGAALAGEKSQSLKIRHTSGKDDRKKQAVQAMGIAAANTQRFVANAHAMMARPASTGDVVNVAKALWPIDRMDASKVALTKWDKRLSDVLAIYERPTNAGGFGQNAWTVLNTFGEYADWERPTRKGTDLATAQADPDSATASFKAKVAQLVMS